jgi:hypothetical protein
MLSDPAEIAIAAGAKQKNIREPKRLRAHALRIARDFFRGVDLSGRYIDLGPGQFDFVTIVRDRGESCVGVDFDPAVVELGHHKGFDAIEMNIRRLPEHEFGESLDGVFNKFALNAFWHWDDEEAHARLVAAIAKLIRPDGWAWIGPGNGIPKKARLDQSAVVRTTDFQRHLFKQHGFTTLALTRRQSEHCGINGKVANNVVFVKNLERRPSLWTRLNWL